jgi:hypothetical protein
VLPLITGEEFAGLVAHEVAHEYVWNEYVTATRRRDDARIRALELRCDGLAVLTLHRLGISSEHLVSAVQKLTWYNERRRFVSDRDHYVGRDDRANFVRAVDALRWRESSPKWRRTPDSLVPAPGENVPAPERHPHPSG